ncbi:MAG: ribonuclease H-like domain-containing protein [Nanoarchaeota archaeon]|nr:ribonuclease H-like domain-containing protein [Nanoarchaeota archaeon]MBU1704924.1 ribonuclease H-like domain-containing protein [Nanoarchaeota archaeon]
MLNNSFLFLQGIGKKLEQNLYKQGISDWKSFLETKNIPGISSKRKWYYDRQLEKARSALYQNNSTFFNLPSSENWRLYEQFRDEAVFLDIEATGVSRFDDITLVGLYDGTETKTMINMDPKALKRELEKYQLIVTYNGATFDLPYISKRYPKLLPDIPSFDLRSACQRVGLAGGLKLVEKQLGINRKNKIVEKMYDGDPLSLWKMYKGSGDEYYLKLLIEYNEEDVINLKPIADHVCPKLKSLTLNNTSRFL